MAQIEHDSRSFTCNGVKKAVKRSLILHF